MDAPSVVDTEKLVRVGVAHLGLLGHPVHMEREVGDLVVGEIHIESQLNDCGQLLRAIHRIGIALHDCGGDG